MPEAEEDPSAGSTEAWGHRHVAANGIRFHVATGIGFRAERPLVLLLHGFPQLWWAWRFQLAALDEAGFSVAAMDLRGYGDSDMTPHGYDPQTTAADVAGVIRSLGFPSGVVVGHDWGGLAAWVTAAYAPQQVQGLASIAAAHPLTRSLLAHVRGAGYLQLPGLGERRLMAKSGLMVDKLLRERAAKPDFLTAQEGQRYREALLRWPSPQCALRYQRRYVRNWLRPSGRQFRRTLRRPLDLPVLIIHGDADTDVPTSAVAATERYLTHPPELVRLAGVGHYPAEEAPEAVNAVLVDWLRRAAPAHPTPMPSTPAPGPQDLR